MRKRIECKRVSPLLNKAPVRVKSDTVKSAIKCDSHTRYKVSVKAIAGATMGITLS